MVLFFGFFADNILALIPSFQYVICDNLLFWDSWIQDKLDFIRLSVPPAAFFFFIYNFF